MAVSELPASGTSSPSLAVSAGVVSRGLSAIVDVAVVLALLTAAYAIQAATVFLLEPRAFVLPDTSVSWFVGVGMSLAVVYLTVSWAVIGGTRGDHVMGLRVVTLSGAVPALWRSAARALLYVIFPLGLLWAAVSPDQRSLQDLLLRTRVVYAWYR
jgi:uncharacterized RDD family membrane protein YckC